MIFVLVVVVKSIKSATEKIFNKSKAVDIIKRSFSEVENGLFLFSKWGDRDRLLSLFVSREM